MSRGPACGDATAETRSAADSTDLGSCRKPFGGCGLAADAKCWILAERGSVAAAPKRGAGIGGTWSRIAGERKRDRRNVEQGPACGMRPWSRSEARRADTDPTRVSGVRSPKGPLFRPSTRPGVSRGSDLAGDRGRRSFASDSGRIPKLDWGPCSTSSAAPLAGCDRGADRWRVE